MSLSDLELDVFRRCNYADTPAAAVKTRIDAFLNQRHRRILSMPGVAKLLDANATFVTVAGQASYTLSGTIQRIRSVYDTTNQRRLTERSIDWLRSVDPGRVSTANTAEAWIPVTQTATHAWTIELWPTPSSVITYNVDYRGAITDLSSPTDEPLLPADFHYVIAAGARVDEYEKLEDKRLGVAKAEYDDGIRKLIHFVENNPDYVVVPGSKPVAFSSLGPWFPAGS